MNEQDAKNVVVNYLVLAQSKGVFTLGDSKIIKEAIDILNPTPSVETPEVAA